jgi:hypothetical protein
MSFTDWLVQASIYFPSSIVVGALALFGVRWTLSGQLKMQRDDWNERQTALQKELQMREQSDREARERRFIAATRAVTVEAINNAVALILFGHLAKKNPFVRFSIALTREQFDSQLPLIAERLSSAHLQQTLDGIYGSFPVQSIYRRDRCTIDATVAAANQGCVKPESKLFRGL